MKLRGYYGYVYDVDDEHPLQSIDHHLAVLRNNYPKLTNHPDIDRLLDARSEYQQEAQDHDD